MERIHMLGTGNAMVTKCYNTCFAIENKNKYLLIDAGGGNGILKQLKKANIAIESIEHIFVTHKHIDHILGVIWLIRLYSAKAAKNAQINSLTIFGHNEVINIIRMMMTMLLNEKQSRSLIGKLSLVEVVDRQVLNVQGHTLTFFDLLSTKDQQFGCHFLLESGVKVTFLGDEPYKDHVEDLAYESDYLMHEAFCLYEHRTHYEPYKKHHATAMDACKNAAKLKVKNVILYHTEDDHLENRKSMYKNEGQHVYEGSILIPDDLEVISLF